jgi:hypothetical protein
MYFLARTDRWRLRVLAMSLFGAVGGCDAPNSLNKFRENQRAEKCVEAGATREELAVCKSTEEGYKQTVTLLKQRRQV